MAPTPCHGARDHCSRQVNLSWGEVAKLQPDTMNAIFYNTEHATSVLTTDLPLCPYFKDDKTEDHRGQYLRVWNSSSLENPGLLLLESFFGHSLNW